MWKCFFLLEHNSTLHVDVHVGKRRRSPPTELFPSAQIYLLLSPTLLPPLPSFLLALNYSVIPSSTSSPKPLEKPGRAQPPPPRQATSPASSLSHRFTSAAPHARLPPCGRPATSRSSRLSRLPLVPATRLQLLAALGPREHDIAPPSSWG